MLLSDYTNQTQQLVHDTSSLDYSQSDMTFFINEARKQVARDFWCVRQYIINLSLIINQETYPITSGVGGARVTAGGVYSNTPTVTFGPPPVGGVQATGVAIMGGSGAAQFVQQIGMTNWGLGYTSVPTVTFGSGAATAIATAMLNILDIYTVSYLSGARRAMLQWAAFGRFNAIFRMNTTNGGPPGVWSGYNEQNLFYVYPANPDFTYPLEIDAYVLPTPLVNTTDSDIQINEPAADVVQWWAAHLALIKSQNFEQAEYFAKKYAAQAQKIGLSRFAPRRPNIYQNVWRRVQRGY
jgi:hypothetical protein